MSRIMASSTATQQSKVATMRRPGISIRGTNAQNVQNEMPRQQSVSSSVAVATPVQQPVVEDIPISEDGLRICWKQFAATLSKEETAMAGRIMNIRPSLTGDTSFTVGIDNKIVAQELRTMQPRIEAYLRQQMQNSRISMQVVLEEAQKVHHIYSRVEQYQQLEQRNQALKKLKELFELDLE